MSWNDFMRRVSDDDPNDNDPAERIWRTLRRINDEKDEDRAAQRQDRDQFGRLRAQGES